MSLPPALAVVLVTDAFSTVEPVVRRLRTQTAAGRVELVLVTPTPDAVRQAAVEVDELAALVVVGVEALVPISAARAAGVRAATAPIVFLGETHSYPEAGWAQALIDAQDGDWAIVVPGFGNANPTSALSWAGFLADYGSWLGALPSRELASVPMHNSAFKRSALLEFGPRLDLLLTSGDQLLVELRGAGRRFLFQPAARIDHVNLTRLWPWLIERYLAGLVTANSRIERWSWRRRLLYAAGSPLIPIVVLARVAGGVSAARRGTRLPLALYPALVGGAALGALGELVGYLGCPVTWAERRQSEYEIHKLRYLRA